MSSHDGRYHIVYNGEVYNYIELRRDLAAYGAFFATKSDTEVILEAFRYWGPEAFSRFIGMFAFALFDAHENKLFLVRDRFGVKPLYYFCDGSSLVFASTPTACAKWYNLRPNLDYVTRGILYKYYEDDSSVTQYEYVYSLRPSTFMCVWLDGSVVRTQQPKYYDLSKQVNETAESIRSMSDFEAKDRLLELLTDACLIRRRADVPLGLSLSGGIDSSSIGAILSRQGSIFGYCFGHPDARNSEAPLVEELIHATRIKPRWVWPALSENLEDLFWGTLRAQDAPFPHCSMIAQFALFRAARADGTLVLLGGQGGDEALMGYRKFYLFYLQSILRSRRLNLLPQFLWSVLLLLPSILKRASTFLVETGRYTKTRGMGTRLRLPPLRESYTMGLSATDTLRERQILDVTRFSLPTLLRYEDRNSMGNSIESRLPFLDHRLIEFGISLSAKTKLNHGYGKWVLRQAIDGLVPDAIRLNRDKRGFDVQQSEWILRGLGSVIRKALQERIGAVGDWLPRTGNIEELFSDEMLISHPQAFKEAVSLIWLSLK